MKLTPTLLDLQGLVYNAYHAAMSPEPLVGDVKEKVNTAAFAFETFLNKFFDPILEICESPIHMIAVLDDGNTYRKAMFPAYKAGRAEKKEVEDVVEKREMAMAMAHAKQFLASLGVPLVKLKGEEADDVIAYLCQNLQGPKIIATIDKDLLVLSGPMVSVFRNGRLETNFNDHGTIVPPHLVSLYLSIVGDSSDGFPGLYREGPKAWEKMVEAFGIDGMEQLQDLAFRNERLQLKSIASVAGNKTLNKIAEDYDGWMIQFKLAQLHPEICTNARRNLEWYKRAPTKERMMKVLEPTGCVDLFKRYEKFVYKAILVTLDNLAEAVKEITELTPVTPAVAWDYETYDPIKNPKHIQAAKGKNYVDVLNSLIAGCSFAVGPNMNRVYYFSIRHADTRNVPQEWVLNLIKHFEEEGVDMVAQNIAFEATITKVQLGHDIKDWHDTKAYGHHVDENNPNGLKLMSKAHLNYDQTDYHTTLKNAGASDMSEISGEQVLEYGCDDSLVTAHLYQYFTFRTQLEGTYDFIREYECPAVQPMTEAYIGGVQMDPEEIKRQTSDDEKTVTEKMALLRSILLEHCTQPNFEGVDNLYEDQKSYVTAKAKEKFKDKGDVDPAAVEGEIKQGLQDYLQKLKDNCRYVAPYEVRNVKEFSPTPAQLTKVAGYFGLPPFDKNSKKYVEEWMMLLADEGVERPPETEEFLAKLPMMFHKKDTLMYLEFKTYCEGLVYDHTIPVMAGTELNLGSPHQMQYLLYLLLALPVRVRTKVQKKSLRHKNGLPGSPSTDASAIDFAMANDCSGEHAWKADALKALKAYAAASTRLSIYWGPYPLWMDENFVMHPNFISPGTVTRRPTGSSPNLLQVSKGKVRKCFVPRSPDNVIVSVDFASQELRVLAAVTGDNNFLSAYTGEKDKDLHAMTACGIVPTVAYKYEGVNPADIWMDGALADYAWFKEHQDDDTPLGKMLKDVRGISKTVNFGVGYGAVGATVSQQAMIPLELAEAAVSGFHEAYPGVNEWKKKLYAFAKLNGYVATTYGSRRHCGNNLTSGNRSEIGRWERQLSNFCIQAQCADLLKVVLANAYRTKLFSKHGAQLIAPIYDELLSEVPRVNLYGFLHDLADLMEIMMPNIIVPMVADCSFGASWGKQEEVGARPTQETIDKALAKIDAYLGEQDTADRVTAAEEDGYVLALVDESDTGDIE